MIIMRVIRKLNNVLSNIVFQPLPYHLPFHPPTPVCKKVWATVVDYCVVVWRYWQSTKCEVLYRVLSNPLVINTQPVLSFGMTRGFIVCKPYSIVCCFKALVPLKQNLQLVLAKLKNKALAATILPLITIGVLGCHCKLILRAHYLFSHFMTFREMPHNRGRLNIKFSTYT